MMMMVLCPTRFFPKLPAFYVKFINYVMQMLHKWAQLGYTYEQSI